MPCPRRHAKNTCAAARTRYEHVYCDRDTLGTRMQLWAHTRPRRVAAGSGGEGTGAPGSPPLPRLPTTLVLPSTHGGVPAPTGGSQHSQEGLSTHKVGVPEPKRGSHHPQRGVPAPTGGSQHPREGLRTQRGVPAPTGGPRTQRGGPSTHKGGSQHPKGGPSTHRGSHPPRRRRGAGGRRFIGVRG